MRRSFHPVIAVCLSLLGFCLLGLGAERADAESPVAAAKSGGKAGGKGVGTIVKALVQDGVRGKDLAYNIRAVQKAKGRTKGKGKGG